MSMSKFDALFERLSIITIGLALQLLLLPPQPQCTITMINNTPPSHIDRFRSHDQQPTEGRVSSSVELDRRIAIPNTITTHPWFANRNEPIGLCV